MNRSIHSGPSVINHNKHFLYLRISEICDDSDDEANDGEYSTNVGHSGEGKGFRRRGSSWAAWVEVLSNREVV